MLTLLCSYSSTHSPNPGALLPSFTTWGATGWLSALLLVAGAVPITLAWAALVSRLLGPVPIGVISRWSLSYVRIWLKTGLLEGAGEWLSGTLFWPWWLRRAGMTIGRNCEISTIIDVVPEHLRIDRDTFFADGIYLGGPRVHRGAVTTALTSLSPDTFVGNHAVIPAGAVLPGNILLGVCTVAHAQTIRPGSSWFGHPPFELPRREIVACDRSLTHEPAFARYWTRVFWETARLTLPWPPILAGLGWYHFLARWGSLASMWTFPLGVGLASLAAAASLCFLVLGLKWALLGRVQPAQHPLWSCWCGRWDFLYVMWSRLARPWLQYLEGSLLLNAYLRGMGMKLGRAVVLGPGFAQVVDPDMIEIGDHATVSAMFQAHTFEDRVLKIGKVRIGAGATVGSATVPLYGADIGDHTTVAPHSVVMKEERLLPGLHYAGSPTRVPSS